MTLEQQETIMEPQKWRHKHAVLWRLMMGILSIIALFFLLIGGLWVFVNTSTGKKIIAAEIQKYTHDRIQIQGITGFVPMYINIAEIQFKNAEIGTWLDVKQVQFNWSPWTLLQGQISVQLLAAKEVNFYSLPPKQVQTMIISKGEKRLVELPLAVDIQDLQIDRLFISEKIAKKDVEMAVNGQVKIRNLSNMLDIDTLKSAFMAHPKFQLFGGNQPFDFQFAGKISASVERNNGKEYTAPLVPLHFSIRLPEYPTLTSNDKLRIYLGLGDKL